MMIGSVVGGVVGGSAGGVSVSAGSPVARTAVGEGATLRGCGALHANTDRTNVNITTDKGLRITVLLNAKESTPAQINMTPS